MKTSVLYVSESIVVWLWRFNALSGRLETSRAVIWARMSTIARALSIGFVLTTIISGTPKKGRLLSAIPSARVVSSRICHSVAALWARNMLRTRASNKAS